MGKYIENIKKGIGYRVHCKGKKGKCDCGGFKEANDCVLCGMSWTIANKKRAKQKFVMVHPKCLKEIEDEFEQCKKCLNTIGNMAHNPID